MSLENLTEARIVYGQGKTATTILTDTGYHYPVIHEPYSHRAQYRQARAVSVPPHSRRGDRPMHRTTLTIAKPPWSLEEYLTTNKQVLYLIQFDDSYHQSSLQVQKWCNVPQMLGLHMPDKQKLNCIKVSDYFSGSKDLEPACRPRRCPSMHTSRITFGTDEQPDRFMTDNILTFRQQEQIITRPPYLKSIENKLNQMEGAKLKEAIKPDKEPQNYWTQYKRVHDKLGFFRGPGVAREFPARQQYDIITGEEKGPAWKPDNPRTSGNRILHRIRQQLI